MSIERIMYGKSDIQHIVGLEVNEDKAIVWCEKDGQVIEKEIPNRFWLLCDKKLGPDWVALDGNLHYKYGRQYKTREEFTKNRNWNRAKDTYSIWNPKEALMVKDGISYFKGLSIKEVSCLSFDIETTGIKHGDDSKVLLISNTYRNHKGEKTRRLFAFDEFESDAHMFDEWSKWVQELNPAIVLGHNIYGYDLPYLNYTSEQVGTQIRLGRDGSAITFDPYESQFRKDGSQSYGYHKCHIYGREIIDTMFLAYKYDVGRKYESYGLKAIIAHEGLEVEGRQFYDAGKIKDNYKDPVEWEKIKQYAIHDADDALELYDLMAPSFFYMSQSIPKPFQLVNESATGSQINAMMVRSYLQEAHSVPKTSEAEQFEGAISMGNPGIYSNVWKVDVASLYPSIILEYQVYDHEKDPKGNFLKLVNTFTEKRLMHKKKAKESQYDDDMQAALKILINSAYGFFGASGLNFNSPKKAAFITEKGREILTNAIKWSEEQGFKLINADTDSISIAKSDDSFFGEDVRKELLANLNTLSGEKISWEDDGFYLRLVVLAAKNYIMWDGNKIKFKGSSLKSSSKETAIKEFLKDICETIVFEKYEYEEIYKKYVKEALKVEDIKRWSSKKTITSKVLAAEATTQKKILDAIQEIDYTEGDKVYMFFKKDGSLSVADKFDGEYDELKLIKKLHKSAEVFDQILPVKELFPNLTLKKALPLLENYR